VSMTIEAEEEPRTAWASHSQLPITIPPFAGETLFSYTFRLNEANYLQASVLKTTFKSLKDESRRHYHRKLLSVLTGRTELQVVSALPELRTAAALNAFPHLLGLVSEKAAVRPVCSQCVAAKTRPNRYLRVFATHEDLICMKHLRWLGSDSLLYCAPEDQFSVAGCYQIIVANKRHRRLIRRWGRQEVRGRFGDAVSALFYWRTKGDRLIAEPKVEMCRAALGISDCYWPYDRPKDVASWYPNAVALTELFLQQDAEMKRVGVLNLDLLEAGIKDFSEKIILGLEPSGARDPFLSRRIDKPFDWPAEVEIPGTR
jgi:hypothetical protein